VRYCLRYRFLPEGRRGRAALWVEDTGVCKIDAEGRPSVAQGTLRVINDRREREERLERFPNELSRGGFPNQQRSDSSCMLEKGASMHGQTIVD
jgi:hypothetical protein